MKFEQRSARSPVASCPLSSSIVVMSHVVFTLTVGICDDLSQRTSLRKQAVHELISTIFPRRCTRTTYVVIGGGNGGFTPDHLCDVRKTGHKNSRRANRPGDGSVAHGHDLVGFALTKC